MFWMQAKRYFYYVSNRLPKWTAKGLMSPYQFETGKISNLSHIRVWGCKAWVHIPKVKRTKDFKAKALIVYLMGYNEHQLGDYIIIIPELVKFVLSKDVKFDESIPQGPIDTHVNDYFKEMLTLRMNENKKGKELEEYKFLVGNVYFDPDKELQCRCVVTRISQKGRNIIAFFKRIIEGEVAEDEFDDKGIHVAEIEKLLDIYLSENAVDELNMFVEKSTRLIDAENKSNNTWSNDVDENESSTRLSGVSTRLIDAKNKSNNTWPYDVDENESSTWLSGASTRSIDAKNENNNTWLNNVKENNQETSKSMPTLV